MAKWEEVKNKPHDISGIKNPENCTFKKTNGVYYPIEPTKKLETMNLSEIIKTNESHTTSILTSELLKYKKALLTYYSDLFCSEPVLLVSSVSNACSYAKIVPSGEFSEAVYALLGVSHVVEDEKEEGFDFDLFAQYETINANSIFLKNL